VVTRTYSGVLVEVVSCRFHMYACAVYQAQSNFFAEQAGRNYNEGGMRIVVGCLLVVAGSVVLTQSSQDLHNRYGEPDRERFSARPGISLTVEYGSDHLACNALIEPPQPLTYTEEHVPLMSSGGVSEVLEEVAPVAMRGKEINAGVLVSGSTHTCEPANHYQDVRTTITFKREWGSRRTGVGPISHLRVPRLSGLTLGSPNKGAA